MTFTLENFRVAGLHGHINVSIPFSDNKLVLVGENGTGKTTIANLIYFLLTRQWGRLAAYSFDTIEMKFASERTPFVITGQDIRTISSTTSREFFSKVRGRYPSSLLRRMEDIVSRHTPSQMIDDRLFRSQISEQYALPSGLLFDYCIALMDEEESDESARIGEKRRQISELLEGQILYLPTYRRIERELKYIYPELESDEFRYRPRGWKLRHRERINESYVELVEFGMDDVESTIKKVMAELTENLRKNLNNLTGQYLREVIDGEYEDIDTSPLNQEDVNVEAILDRVGENLLRDTAKTKLTQIIASLDGGPIEDFHEKVILHFLVRLVQLHQRQERSEQAVVDFKDACNVYLKGKSLSFDNKQFAIEIEHEEDVNDEDSGIKLSMLSSGEKQIVSLFSHLYLAGQDGYFVIIDEPELSLSVPWQKRFLPDILDTGKCSGLIAVTHSPFIFDNRLAKYAHDIKEFRE